VCTQLGTAAGIQSLTAGGAEAPTAWNDHGPNSTAEAPARRQRHDESGSDRDPAHADILP
jgi:hypothetical protein